MRLRAFLCGIVVALALVVAGARDARAQGPTEARPERVAIELAWRWSASPFADAGPRVLDTVDLGVRIPLAPHFAVLPYGGVGVSYGDPWYLLLVFGAEAVVEARRDGLRPRVALGMAYAGEAISSQGGDALRRSFASDLAFTLRGGADYAFRNFTVGLDLRVAAMPRDRLAVHGPFDVGGALRVGCLFPWRPRVGGDAP